MNTLKSNRKAVLGLVLALALVLGVVGLVLADVVNNDVTTNGTDTFTAGGSTTVSYKVVATGGDGQSGCNPGDGSAATVTINVPAGVTANPASLAFTSCNDFQPVIFSSSTPGNYSISVSVSDSGAGSYNTTPAAFTLHVLPAPPTDSTPPVITPSVSGTLGNNGWYTSDVTVSWSVADGESTISSTSGCETTTIDYDTAGETLTCTATSAGGASSESVPIKRDATAPTISASVSPALPGSGWWNIASGAPTVTYTCGDLTSGVASCTGPYTFAEGENQTHTGTAVDNAGNENTASVNDIDVDLTAPTLTWIGGPADGGTYYFGFVPAEPTCTAVDTLSGPGSCGVTGYDASAGLHTMTALAYDVAGNSRSENRSYTVQSWSILGFYQPVDMNGVINTVKNGSTVPLKFEVFIDGVEKTDTASLYFWANLVSCSALSGTVEDTIEVLSSGGSVLRYDSVAGQFIQNWQTPRGSAYVGKCYKTYMSLAPQGGDKLPTGPSISANFKLK